jgi:hypothetical protein
MPLVWLRHVYPLSGGLGFGQASSMKLISDEILIYFDDAVSIEWGPTDIASTVPD